MSTNLGKSLAAVAALAVLGLGGTALALAGNSASQTSSTSTTSTTPKQGPRQPLATDVARLSDDEVVLLPGRFQLVPGRRIVGATVAVKTLEAAQPIAERAAGKPLETVSRPGSRSVFVPPSSTHGLWLELREVR